MVTTRPPKTIVEPTALGTVANTDSKLLIYRLFQKGRVLAQDGELVKGAEGDRQMAGSSPRVRGTPKITRLRLPSRRFIPARAGNSSLRTHHESPLAVHPRACGEL